MSPDVQLRTARDGVVLVPFRVVPRSSRTEVDGVHDGAIRVRLKAPPVEGAANLELCRYVAKRLKLRRGEVEIVAGAQSRSKTLSIRGATADQILSGLLTD